MELRVGIVCFYPSLPEEIHKDIVFPSMKLKEPGAAKYWNKRKALFH